MLDEHECFQEDVVSINVYLKLNHGAYVIWNMNVSPKEPLNRIQKEMYASACSCEMITAISLKKYVYHVQHCFVNVLSCGDS